MKAQQTALASSDVLVLFNGLLGVSGGDRHLLDMARYWSDLTDDLTQAALPRLAERVVPEGDLQHLQAQFIWSPFERRSVSGTLAVSACYGWRIIACSVARFPHAPKIVVASGHLPFDVIPALNLCRRYQAKSVVYVFHLIQMQLRKPSPRNTLARLAENLALYLIRRNADLVIVDNVVVRDQLRQFGIAADRMRVTPLGIPLDVIRAVPSSPTQFQAVFFGRLTEHKGIYDLLDIWQRVVSEMPGSKLLIVGDGPARSSLAQRIEEKRLCGNIEFVGFVNPPRSYELLKKCRLCLAPSHEEGWGIGICEAMACGLPVVAYDLPVYRSVFRQGMITAPFGDNDGMAQHVIRLLTDHGLRGKMGVVAIQQASEYDVAAIAREQWKWLRDLAA